MLMTRHVCWAHTNTSEGASCAQYHVFWIEPNANSYQTTTARSSSEESFSVTAQRVEQGAALEEHWSGK